ncbi:MAG: SPASM domain-containing protein [Sorangiineae bacterium PRO1]|nr:SPASM domain-containing protein [Sorangiineae bacterium PRO1]
MRLRVRHEQHGRGTVHRRDERSGVQRPVDHQRGSHRGQRAHVHRQRQVHARSRLVHDGTDSRAAEHQLLLRGLRDEPVLRLRARQRHRPGGPVRALVLREQAAPRHAHVVEARCLGGPQHDLELRVRHLGLARAREREHRGRGQRLRGRRHLPGHRVDGSAAEVRLAPRRLDANYRDDWSEASIESLRGGLAAAARVWADRVRDGAVVPVEPFHTKILSHLKGGTPCGSRCVLGNGELTVTPRGRLYPCPQMVGEDDSDEHVIGDLDDGVDFARAAELRAQKERNLETCASCELLERCQNQCGCRHVAAGGELGKITAVLCELEAASIEAADRGAEALVEERVPAFVDYYYRRPWRPAPGAALVQLSRRSS